MKITEGVASTTSLGMLGVPSRWDAGWTREREEGCRVDKGTGGRVQGGQGNGRRVQGGQGNGRRMQGGQETGVERAS